MGWEIARRDHDGEEQFRIWTTITDTWITGWSKREEILKIYADDYMRNAKLKVIEKFIKFPYHSVSHEGGRYRSENGEGATKYLEWLHSAGESDDYSKAVDDKYKEVMAVLDAADWPEDGPDIYYHIEEKKPEGWTEVKVVKGYQEGHGSYYELKENNPGIEFRMFEKEVAYERN